MSSKVKIGWKVIKKNKKGRFFIFPFLLSYVLDKTIHYASLTLLRPNLKKKVYKLYLRYRLKKRK